ncbi:uncharacterized protein LOC124175097 isoform X3 [Neodiprion fabricii]|uniref:uncharacterized protein LOC124175097 isoform X3 n=1 Tax=Neodiprion fabricii TaxID=2872261 RepID=UPI001ED957A9|nr:uncharacterized protein LOC124175097 isoform X3 [Neodiprion fabricii]
MTENHTTMEADLTVRSQNSNDSKISGDSKDSKTSSTMQSKHSKEVLISKKQEETETKNDSNLLMLMSCGQLLLGVILVVFGVLVLVHGASLGNSGAGLWAGAGALVAGALGVVATLTTSADKESLQYSGFSSAHLASSLIALALSNMAAITALTSVVRDSQRSNPEINLLGTTNDDDSVMGVDHRWAGLMASIGLLIASLIELLISGYSCVKLAPRLCGCLKGSSPPVSGQGQLKTHNMVHQWVSSHPKSQQIYLVQPIMSVQPVLPTPYGMATIPKKYQTLIPATGTFPPHSMYHSMPAPCCKMARGPIYPPNPHYHPQMVRIKRKRYAMPEHESNSLPNHRTKPVSPMSQQEVGKAEAFMPSTDQVDLSQTYTGLDKKMSEEFISIAMDPDKKSKASSSNTSEISSAARNSPATLPESKF